MEIEEGEILLSLCGKRTHNEEFFTVESPFEKKPKITQVINSHEFLSKALSNRNTMIEKLNNLTMINFDVEREKYITQSLESYQKIENEKKKEISKIIEDYKNLVENLIKIDGKNSVDSYAASAYYKELKEYREILSSVLTDNETPIHKEENFIFDFEILKKVFIFGRNVDNIPCVNSDEEINHIVQNKAYYINYGDLKGDIIIKTKKIWIIPTDISDNRKYTPEIMPSRLCLNAISSKRDYDIPNIIKNQHETRCKQTNCKFFHIGERNYFMPTTTFNNCIGITSYNSINYEICIEFDRAVCMALLSVM